MTTLNAVPSASTNIQVNTSALKAQLASMLQQIVSAEKNITAQDIAQLQTFSDQMWPLVESQTQALISSKNPKIQQGYLQGLVAAEIDKVAEIAGTNILANKALIQAQVTQFISNLASALLQISNNPILKALIQLGLAAVVP